MNAEDVNSDGDVSENELDILSMLIGDDEEKWRNTRGQIDLINQFIQKGERPTDILKNYFKMNTSHLPEDPLEQWSIILHLIMEGPHRKRLEEINTLQQACDLIKSKNNIMILTGAGISVPCGVPDFRSRNGIYARLAVDFPDLDEPQSMFDINYFCKNPRPFFKFAKEIYPGKFTPSIGHKFIKLLEDKNKLLRNYTQNIDTLEQVAGIKNIIQCHGSFASATCMRCEHKVKGSEIEDDVMNQRIPICTQCTNENEATFDKLTLNTDLEETEESIKLKLPIMKPDVVFFGEGLPKDFHATLAEDKNQADLLIVIGSSLKVRPVAHVPGCLPANVPQILINKEPLSNHSFDVELLGDCDEIVTALCKLIGWEELSGGAEGTLKEKSIYDMKTVLDAMEAEEDSHEEVAKEIDPDGATPELLQLVSVAELLSDEVNCIRVPPNRYVFAGADYVVNMRDVDNGSGGTAPIHAYSYSLSSQSSSDDDDDDDDDQDGDEDAEGNEVDLEVAEETNEAKRRRLSDN